MHTDPEGRARTSIRMMRKCTNVPTANVVWLTDSTHKNVKNHMIIHNFYRNTSKKMDDIRHNQIKSIG